MSDRAAPVSGDRKRSAPSADDVEYLLENDVVDIDTLKQFTIPKKKSQKHGLSPVLNMFCAIYIKYFLWFASICLTFLNLLLSI